MKRAKSEVLYTKAQEVLVGGVNSPVRAFQAVGGTPIFFTSGCGARLLDVDDNEYIDYVCSWGPLILGHAHSEVVKALNDSIKQGTSFGAPTELEIHLAQLITEAMPSMEKVRFVNSGTEATMSALRLARAYTGRNKIIKFKGCYHGHCDFLLVQAGSGVTTLGLPDSPGVPRETTQHTLVAPFNDLEAVEYLFEQYGEDIAAVITEPVAGNMGVVPPKAGFLDGLRQLTQDHGSLLVFDEVMTGFRVSYGSAQELFNVRPDITCLGKVIAGGLPIGAYGGRRQIMGMVAPLGPVYQAGTLSGNPLVMAAGIATLTQLRAPGTYGQLDQLGCELASGLESAGQKAGIPLRVNRVGSMLTPFFTQEDVEDFGSAKQTDQEQYAWFFWGLLERGVYPPPSAFEAWFLSVAHSQADVVATIEVANEVLKQGIDGNQRV